MATKLTVVFFSDTLNNTKIEVPLRQSPSVRRVESHPSSDDLVDYVCSQECDVLAVDLDTVGAINVVERVALSRAECGILGISARTDATFIIQAMRAGCGQFITTPVEPDDLESALQRLRPLRRAVNVRSKRICVIGSSGGVGATTIACNLATELALLSQDPVGLVDLNLEYGDVCCAFDCQPKYSIADVCHDGADVDVETACAAFIDLATGVSILGRPDHLEHARDVTPDGVLTVLQLVAKKFPHIVVDLPRSYNFLSAMAVRDAERILIVTQLGVPPVRNAMRIYQSLQQMGADEDNIEIIVNRSDAAYERISRDDVEAHFRRPVFAEVPNDYQFVSAAFDLGHPIGADAPTSKAKQAIAEMALKLAPEYATASTEKKGNGLFNKLLGRK